MMNTNFKKAALVASASMLVAGMANAVPTVSVSTEGEGNAYNAEQAFLLSLNAGTIKTDDFENGYTVGAQNTTIASTQGVGSFEMTLATSNNDGKCDLNNNSFGYNCENGLAVLNQTNSPFNGRFSTPTGNSNNWLDSMDALELTFEVASGKNAVGFYVTDPNDVNGLMSIGGVDFSFGNIFGTPANGAEDNARIFYVSITDFAADLGDIVFYTNGDDDGYGLDKVTVGRVPEPGTLALLGLGIAGLTAARRKQKA